MNLDDGGRVADAGFPRAPAPDPAALQSAVHDKMERGAVYDYVNFIEKCFGPPPPGAGAPVTPTKFPDPETRRPPGRSCKKCGSTGFPLDAQHKCVRGTSAAHWPTKRVERLAARCIQHMAQVESPGPGDSAGRAPSHFQARSCIGVTSRLERIMRGAIFPLEYVGVCIMCGGPKHPWGLSHGDSSAMFDEAQESAVRRYYNDLRQRVDRKTANRAVFVQTAKPHHAWLGHRPRETGLHRTHTTPGPRVDPPSFGKIDGILCYSAATNFSARGDRVSKRRRGIVMGPALSPCKSGLIYRAHERRFPAAPDRWKRWGMETPQRRGHPISKYVGVVRIEDGDVLASTIHCPCCAAQIGAAPYPSSLKHDSEEAGTAVSVIDIRVETHGFHWRAVRIDKQSTTGGLPEQIRTRYHPAYDYPLCSAKVRASWVVGALALGWQRQSAPAHCRAQGLLCVVELLRMGHSLAHLPVACRRIRHPRLRKTAQFVAEVLNKWRKVYGSFDDPHQLTMHQYIALAPQIQSFPAVAMFPIP